MAYFLFYPLTVGLNLCSPSRDYRIQGVLPTYVGLNPRTLSRFLKEQSVLPTYVGLNLPP